MPTLKICDEDGYLRWDASCLLLSTIMVPEDIPLRGEYSAALRLEKAQPLPDGHELLTKRDHILGAKFRERSRIKQIMQTRRIHSMLAGAMLWNLHTAQVEHPSAASKNKIRFAIDRISIAQNKIGSYATLHKAWRQFRPVIHWCTALAYQSRAFGRLFPQSKELGYVGDVVVCDFLSLGDIFLEIARNNVVFPEGKRASFWTAPKLVPSSPRDPSWPDAHMLRPGITLGAEFLETVSSYTVERDALNRDWLTTGPARRYRIARSTRKTK